MLRLNRLKLKHQLLLLITISSIMLILLLIYYYVQFYKLTEERGSDYHSNIMTNVKERLNYDARVMKDAAVAAAYNTIVQQFLVAEDTIERIELNKVVVEILHGIGSSNKNIKAIMIYDNKERLIGPSVYPGDYRLFRKLKEEYRFDDDTFHEGVYTDIIINRSEKIFHYAYIVPIYSTNDKAGQFQKIATCIVIYNTNSLDEVTSNVSTTESSLLAILDGNDVIVSSNNLEMKGLPFDMSRLKEMHKLKQANIVEYSGKQVIFQKIEVPDMNWKIVSLVPAQELTSEVRKIRNDVFIIGIIIIILVFIMGYIFNRNVTSPIEKMVKFTRGIRDGNMDQRLTLKEQNEMAVLAGGINKMLDTIDEMNQQYVNTKTSLYQSELAKKQAELSALQNQINPHFLYNTLETMRSIGLAYDVDEIVQISTSMAKIFRYNIKENNIVRVKDELETVKHYLSIMNIRYQNKILAIFEIDDGLYDEKILKMILQPIVENAVYHGLERKEGQGRLTIRGNMLDDEYIIFEIEDDGIGIESEELAKLVSYLEDVSEQNRIEQEGKRSIGLVNIHVRIKMHFGNRYGLSITSEENVGTKVKVILPVIGK